LPESEEKTRRSLDRRHAGSSHPLEVIVMDRDEQ